MLECYFVYLFTADQSVPTRFSRKFVCDEFWWRQGSHHGTKITIFMEHLCLLRFSLFWRLSEIIGRFRTVQIYLRLFARIIRGSRTFSTSHFPRRPWLTVYRGQQVWGRFCQTERFHKICLGTFRAGSRVHGDGQNHDFHRKWLVELSSQRAIFRGQGEVGAKLKLSTDVRLAPFNLDFLEISSYEFSSEYE